MSSGGAPAGCSKACDCDGDGAEAASCSGQDCDDANPDVHPTQSMYFAIPSKLAGFDFDCSRTLDRDPRQGLVDCSLFTVTQCDTTIQGFLGILPQCGQMGAWGTCKRGVLSCDQDPRGQETMRCK